MEKDRLIDLVIKECISQRIHTILCAFNSCRSMYEFRWAVKDGLLYRDKSKYYENLPTKMKYGITNIYFVFDGAFNLDGINPDLLILQDGDYKDFKFVPYLMHRTKYVKNSKILYLDADEVLNG